MTYSDLKGKKVLVTGSSSGIGRATDINLGLTKSKMPVR
jgi:NADP-dependent 3-hydroxy acid dehydrogenase YdfG